MKAKKKYVKQSKKVKKKIDHSVDRATYEHFRTEFLVTVKEFNEALKNIQARIAFIENNGASSQSVSDEMSRLKESCIERFIRIETVLKDNSPNNNRYGFK